MLCKMNERSLRKDQAIEGEYPKGIEIHRQCLIAKVSNLGKS